MPEVRNQGHANADRKTNHCNCPKIAAGRHGDSLRGVCVALCSASEAEIQAAEPKRLVFADSNAAYDETVRSTTVTTVYTRGWLVFGSRGVVRLFAYGNNDEGDCDNMCRLYAERDGQAKRLCESVELRSESSATVVVDSVAVVLAALGPEWQTIAPDAFINIFLELVNPHFLEYIGVPAHSDGDVDAITIATNVP